MHSKTPLGFGRVVKHKASSGQRRILSEKSACSLVGASWAVRNFPNRYKKSSVGKRINGEQIMGLFQSFKIGRLVSLFTLCHHSRTLSMTCK